MRKKKKDIEFEQDRHEQDGNETSVTTPHDREEKYRKHFVEELFEKYYGKGKESDDGYKERM